MMLARLPAPVRKLARRTYTAIANVVLRPALLEAKLSPAFPVPNERLREYTFTMECLSALAARRVLDVGTGASSLPALLETAGIRVRAIDQQSSYWQGGFFNHHVLVERVEAGAVDGTYDAVLLISTLEHIPEWREAVATLARTSRHLVLTVPYTEGNEHPNIHPRGGLTRVFGADDLREIEAAWGGEVVSRKLVACWSGARYYEGEQVPPHEVSDPRAAHVGLFLISRSE